jgi:hypothetical protein
MTNTHTAHLDLVARAAATKARAAERKHDADAALVDAVMAAREAGETLEAIGDAAGLTKQRVGQIIAGHRAPAAERS